MKYAWQDIASMVVLGLGAAAIALILAIRGGTGVWSNLLPQQSNSQPKTNIEMPPSLTPKEVVQRYSLSQAGEVQSKV